MPLEAQAAAALAALADHCAANRGELLQAWRDGVLDDCELPTANSLPRSQFFDHIPQILDGFEHSLRNPTERQAQRALKTQTDDAAAHGLQRWQQGYDLREVTIEWGRLHLSVADVLERYAADHPSLPTGVMAIARRNLTKLCSRGISESTSQYFKLRQAEAEGHVRDLGQALSELQQLEQDRAELWRQAAHDLRGNLGVVVNAAEILRLTGTPQQTQEAIFDSLQRSVTSMHSMLNDVLSLARLQAGQEQLQVKHFDAAKLIRDLCHNFEPLAAGRGLYLKSTGAPELLVEGDPVKVQRIAQNLLINALKYSLRGGVTVSWGNSRQNDADRWMLTVEDTGPGFHSGPGAPVVEALEEATEEAHRIDVVAGTGAVWKDALPTTRQSVDDRPIHQEVGEGIGLSIVKRLSELLLASIEVDSRPGSGTTFRVILPRCYPATSAE
ncbi:MAG TPA: HAMP domain-containing sensor histidine kinase [Caulifigura sp.]|jgi:signal transduction histidine kinase|nr:HAMP domain-containing sensor histidine kinase [Caulifigura sp.]